MCIHIHTQDMLSIFLYNIYIQQLRMYVCIEHCPVQQFPTTLTLLPPPPLHPLYLLPETVTRGVFTETSRAASGAQIRCKGVAMH